MWTTPGMLGKLNQMTQLSGYHWTTILICSTAITNGYWNTTSDSSSHEARIDFPALPLYLFNS